LKGRGYSDPFVVLSHAGQTSKLRAGILDDGTAYYLAPTVQPNPAKQKRDPSDFNPIENCASKVKRRLRASKARTLETPEPAMADPQATVTAPNATSRFRHCGYGLCQW
jgi:hypothetical protein